MNTQNSLVKIFQSHLLKSSQVYFWKIIQGQLVAVNVQCISAGSKLSKFKVEDHALYSLSKIIGGLGKIQIYIEDEGYAGIAELLKFESDMVIEVGTITDIEKFERRRSTRYSFKELYQLKIELDKGATELHYCSDISSGGFSVLVTNSQAVKNTYKEGENAYLYLGKEAAKLKILIKTVEKLRPYTSEQLPFAKYRVSFQFVELPEHWVDSINDFIEKKMK